MAGEDIVKTQGWMRPLACQWEPKEEAAGYANIDGAKRTSEGDKEFGGKPGEAGNTMTRRISRTKGRIRMIWGSS